jgi:RNA polymerase-binding transcription factor DksA
VNDVTSPRGPAGGGSRGPRQDIDLCRFERLLRGRQSRAGKAFEDLKDHTFSLSQKESTGEDSSYDQHSADMASSTFERGKDLGLKDGLEIGLAKIGLALERVRKGDYGYCLRCGKPIPAGRLEAAPEAELCIECAREEEVRPASRRPVEEQNPTPFRQPMGGIEMLADDVNPTREDRPAGGTRPRPR